MHVVLLSGSPSARSRTELLLEYARQHLQGHGLEVSLLRVRDFPAEALLHAQGVGRVKRYQGNTQQEALFDAGSPRRLEEALAWAREQKVRYAVVGAVDEWRYKVGVDGEPAAGITLQIIDVGTGDTLWSGAGGKSGWSREALSAVGQKLIRELLQSGLAGAR